MPRNVHGRRLDRAQVFIKVAAVRHRAGRGGDCEGRCRRSNVSLCFILGRTMSLIECHKGHLMEEISSKALKHWDGECAWCQQSINTLSVGFALAKLKKNRQSMADFAVFTCASCNTAMCWDCARPRLDDSVQELAVDSEGARVVEHMRSKASSAEPEDETAEMCDYFKKRGESKNSAGGGGCSIL
mmetsp:Transcript_88060/g.188993  ORF Transcript_88060/g.188993 Transcript_88060/m.188993 type:complete len:186 (+) Transcript_88060:88-645(+)